jgi:adenosine deaminase CECR1
LKKEFPHLIAGWYFSYSLERIKIITDCSTGFDLVGNENELTPLIDYIEPLLKFRVRQKEEGVDIPFIFHAGETLGDGSVADMNVYDAILLGTKRIGHGFVVHINPPTLSNTCTGIRW